ncbi:MAG: hypothetical protein A2186_02560 [Candidatus Levybacteria bacterium RIFOXYA1_FULL_41_10]
MDPNKVGQLDPKLKEAYERVMRTTVTPPISQSAAPMQSAQAAPSSTPPIVQPPVVASPLSPLPPIPPSPTITATHASFQSGNIPSASQAYKAGTMKAGKKGVPTILWALLASVFFVAYTLVWTKVLGVSLPFLP